MQKSLPAGVQLAKKAVISIGRQFFHTYVDLYPYTGYLLISFRYTRFTFKYLVLSCVFELANSTFNKPGLRIRMHFGRGLDARSVRYHYPFGFFINDLPSSVNAKLRSQNPMNRWSAST